MRPDAEEILRLVLASIDDMKAEDTVTIDLTGKTSIADAMVVTSGRSNRQVGAIADRLLDEAALASQAEPLQTAETVRAFYNLEKMWASPPRGRQAS